MDNLVGLLIFTTFVILFVADSIKTRRRQRNKYSFRNNRSADNISEPYVCPYCGSKLREYDSFCTKPDCISCGRSGYETEKYLHEKNVFDSRLKDYFAINSNTDLIELIHDQIICKGNVIIQEAHSLKRITDIEGDYIWLEPPNSFSYGKGYFKKIDKMKVISYIVQDYTSSIENRHFLETRFDNTIKSQGFEENQITFLSELYSLVLNPNSSSNEYEQFILKWETMNINIMLDEYIPFGILYQFVALLSGRKVNNDYPLYFTSGSVYLFPDNPQKRFDYLSKILRQISRKKQDNLKTIANEETRTAFLKLLLLGFEQAHDECLFELMLHDFDVSKIVKQFSETLPLISFFIEQGKYVASQKMVKFCFDVNARANTTDQPTPLVVALLRKDVTYELINTLLQNGADSKYYSKVYRYYPFEIALNNNRQDLVDLLSEY